MNIRSFIVAPLFLVVACTAQPSNPPPNNQPPIINPPVNNEPTFEDHWTPAVPADKGRRT